MENRKKYLNQIINMVEKEFKERYNENMISYMISSIGVI